MSESSSDFKARVKAVFDSVKCKAKNDVLIHIPVRNEAGSLLAYLRPIIQEYRLTDPYLPSLLSKWRIENPTISTGTFKVTVERTAAWIDNAVVGRDDRLIFMVIGLNGQPLGHLGFSNFDFERREPEIDSVLRGVKSTIPGLMTQCTRTLMAWGFAALELHDISLSVFSDNESAVRFYERLQFRVIDKRPLYKVILADEEKYEIAPPNYQGPVGKYYLKMKYIGEKPSC